MIIIIIDWTAQKQLYSCVWYGGGMLQIWWRSV